MDRILRNTLIANLKNPNIITNQNLIEVGLHHFSQDSTKGLTTQTQLVAKHHPTDLETYLQGLLNAVPLSPPKSATGRKTLDHSQEEDWPCQA